MIVNAFLGVISNWIQGVASLLPAANTSLDASIATSVSVTNALYASISAYTPMQTLLVCFGSVLVFEGTYAAYKLIKWAYTKIPGIS